MKPTSVIFHKNSKKISNFLKDGKLPSDQQQTEKVALQGNTFTIIDDILIPRTAIGNGHWF